MHFPAVARSRVRCKTGHPRSTSPSTDDAETDISIYKAVYWHTTANPDLDELGKVVFIADKLDPAKIASYTYLPQIRQMALQDLDRAILHFLTRQAMDRLNRGGLVHPVMVETRNALLAACGVPENST